MLVKCLEMYVVFGAIVIMRLLAVVRRNGNAIASVLYSTKGVYEQTFIARGSWNYRS